MSPRTAAPSAAPTVATAEPGVLRDLFWVAALPTALRWLLIGSFELSEDEAYYWEWSRRLAPGYHDQGPGVALAIRLGTALFGDTVFGVRFPSTLLLAGALALSYRLLREMYGRDAAFWGGLLLNAVPLFALAGVLMLHESVQAFFWALALWTAWRATGPRTRPREALGAWLLTGLCVGLGFSGKFTMVLFAPALLVFLLLGRDDRRWLWRPHPFLAAALALAVASPVLWWNVRHGWTSAGQVLDLALRTRGSPDPLRFASLLGSQLLIVTPLLYGLMLWRLAAAWRRGVRGVDRRERFLFVFTAIYAAPFYVLSFGAKVYANWPGLGYLTGLLLVAVWVAAHRREPGFARSAAGRTWRAGLALAAAATLVLYLHLAFRILPLPGNLDPAKRFTGWPEMGRWAHAIAQEYAARGEPVHYYARTYQIAALLAFYVPGQPAVHEVKRASRGNQYDHWGDLPEGADALLVVHRDQAVPEITTASFAQVTPLADRTLEIERRGGVAQRFRAYHCRGYRPPRP